MCHLHSAGTAQTYTASLRYSSRRWTLPLRVLSGKVPLKAEKVCTILNWLGNNAYEIYEHLHWAAADDKDDPDKVLKAFESYFKPEQNQFHSWCTLGSIYSSQFKCQHDFLTRLREVACDCSFINADEIVRFLFLTHNQNTHVREELLKSMKTTYSLHDALHIAHLAEGTMHTEELSKQYTVKKDTQIDSIHHNKPKQDKSQGKGHGQQNRSNSGKQRLKTGRNCHNCGSKHPPRRCPAYGKECYYCKKKGHYSKCCHTRAHFQSSQCKSRKELHDMEQEPHGSGQYFEFEQVGINVIHLGNNVNGFKGNSNVLLDEIDGPNQRILTDLHVQGASNLKDYNPVSSKCQGPVLKCRFKVDSGASGNIIPHNMFQELYPGMSKSALKNSINHRTCLVAYNKEEIKQLGTSILKVNYGGKTLTSEFFVISSKFKPIIGLDASHNLGLLTINCPIYHSWTRDTRNTPIDTLSSSFDAISGAGADIPEKISKDWIINNPKYKHLFQGIGRFKCDPVQIKIACNAIPAQKPPRKVPLALKDQFKQELDNVVSQSILSKLDNANVNVLEWLDSFVVVKRLNGKLHRCLDPTDLNQYIVRPVCNARTLDEVIALLKDAVY